MQTPEIILLMISLLLFVAAVMTKVCYKIGMPTLIMFLGIGLVAGSEGFMKIEVADPMIALLIGTFALCFIIFNGGLSTAWQDMKNVLTKSVILATLGVLLTALITAVFAYFFLKVSFLEALLLGSVISSTDAAATFSILRSNGIKLKRNIGELLEFESGSNDPMSYMLTITVISLMTVISEGNAFAEFSLVLFKQLSFGCVFGLGLGFLMPRIMSKIKMHNESVYPIITVGLAFFVFGFVSLLGGNGFLAVYIAGVVFGDKEFTHKKSVTKFFDSQAWLMQIILFVTLGLMVYPSRLPDVALDGIGVSLFVMLVARPAVIFFLLSFFKVPFKDMIFISIAGLRGAASMVFAIYPLIYGLPFAQRLFHIVFFVAVTSIIFQGSLLTFFAKHLNLVEPINNVVRLDNFSKYIEEMEDNLMDVTVVEHSIANGKSIRELELPEGVRIIRIKRGNKFISPTGPTVVKAYDDILLLVQDRENVEFVRVKFEEIHEDGLSGAVEI